MNINVYNGITNKGYICKGERLYSPDEMKVMLKESGLTAAQMQVAYELNTAIAEEEVAKMEKGLSFIPEGYENILEGTEAYEEIHSMNTMEAFMKMLLIIQIGLLIITFFAYAVAEVPFIHYGFVFGAVLLSYILTLIVVRCFKSSIQDDTDDFISRSIADPKRKEMEALLENKKSIMYSMQNTVLMYKTMGKYLGYADDPQINPDIQKELEDFRMDDWVDQEPDAANGDTDDDADDDGVDESLPFDNE